MQILQSHGLNTVPQKSHGTYTDYSILCDALAHIYDEVYSSPLAKTEEGAVIYFVERAAKGESVISMAKIKSATYTVLKLIQSTLANAVLDGFSTNYETLFTNFIKQLRSITRHAKSLALNDTQFSKIFSIGYSFIARKGEADMEMYRGLLEKDSVKFFALALAQMGQNEQLSLDFESSLLSDNAF